MGCGESKATQIEKSSSMACVKSKINQIRKTSTINRNLILKIAICGDRYSGKTSFAKMFTYGSFNSNYRATIGVDFCLKSFELGDSNSPCPCKIQIWDISGAELHSSLINSYLMGASCALIVIDSTNLSDLNSTIKWCAVLKEYITKYYDKIWPIGLIFTKKDLVNIDSLEDEIDQCVQACARELPENTPIFILITSNASDDELEAAARLNFIKDICNKIPFERIEDYTQASAPM